MVNVRAETAWLCLSPRVNASQWAAREPGHVLQPKYWSGQQLTLSADTGRELQLTLMYREKVTFAMSFPSVSASVFHLLLGCRQSFVQITQNDNRFHGMFRVKMANFIVSHKFTKKDINTQKFNYTAKKVSQMFKDVFLMNKNEYQAWNRNSNLK